MNDLKQVHNMCNDDKSMNYRWLMGHNTKEWKSASWVNMVSIYKHILNFVAKAYSWIVRNQIATVPNDNS